ncbi:hypothetical protein CDCA_CDCA04G1351 [Cyanidium caldarium]|uniref:Acetyl-coenzyme A synthetase n=1 Tax=Cyanidium caldarium TaxID=2771 RepID=A0AAV9IT18_CYACA|nr:hypothetical protein CDCA_CDCA04G1351 [Cyanidium caldarium]
MYAGRESVAQGLLFVTPLVRTGWTARGGSADGRRRDYRSRRSVVTWRPGGPLRRAGLSCCPLHPPFRGRGRLSDGPRLGVMATDGAPSTTSAAVGNEVELAAAGRTTQGVPPSDTYLKESGHWIADFAEYADMYRRSVREPERFWTELAAREFVWHPSAAPTVGDALQANFDVRHGRIEVQWFRNARTNICYNAVDRHVHAGRGDQVAFHYEANDVDDARAHRAITYAQLLEMVRRMAQVLRDAGVQRGEPVAIYMPMVPELPAAMLACARIGAVHSVVFGGFSAESLAGRIADAQCRVVITCDGVMRGSKLVLLKQVADEAIALCESRQPGFRVHTQLVLRRVPERLPHVTMMPGRDRDLHQAMAAVDLSAAAAPATATTNGAEAVATDGPLLAADVEWVHAEEPLFILYTSGSTGKPKGVLHTVGGYMVGAASTFKYAFNVRPDDVYFCTADCGWITGHSYGVYGPMLNGATQVLFEGVPTWPDAGRLWAIVDKYRVTHLYTAPTAIRALKKAGDAFVKRYSRRSLKLLATVGEPINPQVWGWYHQVVGDGRCNVVDTYWQTETGAHMIVSPPVRGFQQKPGSAGVPFFGVQLAVLDASGREIPFQPGVESEGLLCIRAPWPSCIRSIYGDHERMESVYFKPFPGYYLTGDGCRRDGEGYFWLTGRVDDVINVSGHRMGTAEVESALLRHPAVAEAAVVGMPHEIKGEGICCFVTLNDGYDGSGALRDELVQMCRREIGPIASPDRVQWAAGLPKTRSGKIMRRILRKLAEQGKHLDVASLGDLSTLADPSVVDALVRDYVEE